jgi:hypothetical protein
MPCTGHQVVEIECTVCNKWKGLEDYAKSQRTKPDEAVSLSVRPCLQIPLLTPFQECFACVDDRLNQNPVSEDIYIGEDRTKAIAPADEDVATNWPSAFTSTVTGSDAVSRFNVPLAANFRSDQDRDGRTVWSPRMMAASPSQRTSSRSCPFGAVTTRRSSRPSMIVAARSARTSGRRCKPSPGTRIPPAHLATAPASIRTSMASLRLVPVPRLLALCTPSAPATLSATLLHQAGPRSRHTYVLCSRFNIITNLLPGS